MEPSPTDILDLNIGGKAFLQCQRATLCQVPDSMLCSMFSGRWGGQRDSQGRIFLDHDPELFEIIVEHLRIKKLEDPSAPIPPPDVPQGKRLYFLHMLGYFGLWAAFFNIHSSFFRDCSNLELVCSSGSSIDCVSSTGDRTHISCTANQWLGFQYTDPVPARPQNHWWKIKVEEVHHSLGELSVGIGTKGKFQLVQSKATAWSGHGQGLLGGVDFERNVHYRFMDGDCLHFCFDESKMLWMCNAKKGLVDKVGPSTATEPHVVFVLKKCSIQLCPMTILECFEMEKLITSFQSVGFETKHT